MTGAGVSTAFYERQWHYRRSVSDARDESSCRCFAQREPHFFLYPIFLFARTLIVVAFLSGDEALLSRREGEKIIHLTYSLLFSFLSKRLIEIEEGAVRVQQSALFEENA